MVRWGVNRNLGNAAFDTPCADISGEQQKVLQDFGGKDLVPVERTIINRVDCAELHGEQSAERTKLCNCEARQAAGAKARRPSDPPANASLQIRPGYPLDEGSVDLLPRDSKIEPLRRVLLVLPNWSQTCQKQKARRHPPKCVRADRFDAQAIDPLVVSLASINAELLRMAALFFTPLGVPSG
jgi:hypothetical protein